MISITVRLWLFIAVLVLAAATGSQSTFAADEDLPNVDIDMPWPVLFANSTNEFVIAVQWLPEGFSWHDKTVETAAVQIAVVDLAQRKIVVQRDWPIAKWQIAVGRDELYLLNSDAGTASAVSLRDLKDLRSVAWEAISTNSPLFVAGDQLLCSNDGKIRLDLPSLLPSKKWAALPIDPKLEHQFPIAPRRMGWLIDGIIFDHALKQPLWMPYWEDERALPGPYNPRPGIDRTWDQSTGYRVDGDRERLNAANSSVYPVSMEVSVPKPELYAVDTPVQLRCTHIGGERLGTMQAGAIPARFIKVVGSPPSAEYRWNYSQLGRPSDATIGGTTESAHYPFAPLIWAGRRACVAVGGRLHIWEFEEDRLLQLAQPFRVEPKTPLIAVEYDHPSEIEANLVNGIGPYQIAGHRPWFPQDKIHKNPPSISLSPAGTLTIHPSRLEEDTVGREPTERLLSRMGIELKNALEYAKERTPLIQRMLGRPPRGVPIFLNFSFTVNDRGRTTGNQQAELTYRLLVEVPSQAISQTIDEIERKTAEKMATIKEAEDAVQAKAKAQQDAAVASAANSTRSQREAINESRKASGETSDRLTVLITVLRVAFRAAVIAGMIGVVGGVIYLFRRQPKSTASRVARKTSKEAALEIVDFDESK